MDASGGGSVDVEAQGGSVLMADGARVMSQGGAVRYLALLDVVVGSALINVMATAMESGGTSEAAIAAAKSLLGDIRTGIDSLS